MSGEDKVPGLVAPKFDSSSLLDPTPLGTPGSFTGPAVSPTPVGGDPSRFSPIAEDCAADELPTDPTAGPDAASSVDSPVASCPGCPRCTAKITSEQLKEIFTTASDEAIDDMKGAFNDAYEKFSINTCLRKSHFFAQIREEVGGSIKSRVEDLHYREAALKKTFSYFRDRPEEAALYGRNDDHGADPVEIGNRAYANRNGNGDVASGDGYKYRGKGYIQLTGKGNYQAVQDEIDAKYPESGVDIIANEDDILTPKGGMVSAMAYWSMNNINAAADEGETDADVDGVTDIVNSGTSSREDRKTHFKTAKVAFRLAECTNKPEAAASE